MPRKTESLRRNRMFRMTDEEYERLGKSAEALCTTRTGILMRGLALVEAEIEQQKRQASNEKQPA